MAIIYIYKKECVMSKIKDVLYNYGDEVSFFFDRINYTGTIEIIDRFGYFFDNSEPYYDIYIMYGEEKILVKHIPQSNRIFKCRA